jgi:hypothetical protein
LFRKRLLAGAIAAAALAASAFTGAAQARTDSFTSTIGKMRYEPEPKYSQLPPLPDPAAVPKPNPSRSWNAYDLNVFETIWFPERQAGDTSAKDAPGGAVAHGVCPPQGCANHSLEFIRFWKKSMSSIVEPFGGAVHAYKFDNPGSEVPPYVLASPGGEAYNLQATIPGAVRPELSVIVSGHYDQTDSGPASAWDSAEGHATVFRIAKIMTDYWRRTGTRPAVSVKFTAWAAEESGTYGSEAYVRDNVVPFPNARPLGYFNLDPCGGAYPAFYRGNPAYQVKMVMQLSDPNKTIFPAAKKSITAFNKQARHVLGDVMNHLDDTLTDVVGSPEIFVSDEEAKKKGIPSQEPMVVPALGGLGLFTSDYRNFETIGVPILNLFPDMFGYHRSGPTSDPGWHPDGLTILHTQNDNLRSLNALTGVDQSGLTASQGWYKGLEFCAHMHAWFMLQQNMGGAVKRSNEPVAYFEALADGAAPFETKKALTFDASGSHAYVDGKLVPIDRLRFVWDFDDGSSAQGAKVRHAFSRNGFYDVQLTVIAPSGERDKMTLVTKIGV